MYEFAFGKEKGDLPSGMALHVLSESITAVLGLDSFPYVSVRDGLLYVRSELAAERYVVEHMKRNGYVHLESKRLSGTTH